MKTLILVAAILLPSVVRSQGAAGPSGTPDDIKTRLVQIEREIGQANLSCDYKYFTRVEADEFIFTDAAGGTTNKAEDLAGEKDCRKSDGTYTVDEPRVSLYGNTAVVTARVTTSRNGPNGSPVIRRSRFTDVFVWRDGRWQLVAGHSSRIPDDKKP